MRLRKSSGCVLDMKMREGSGSVAGDSSRYGNDGSLNGGVEWTERGMRFDGSTGYVDCGNNESLNFGTGSFTLAGWVKTPQSSSGIMIIIGQGFSGAHSLKALYLYNGYLKGSIEDNAGHTVDSSSNGGTWNDGSWHFGVCVFDRNNDLMIRYVDGIQIGTQTDISSVTGSTDSSDFFQVGSYNAGASGKLNGDIAEVQIYNRALSLRKIKRLYAQGVSGVSA